MAALEKEKNRNRPYGATSFSICNNHTEEEEKAATEALEKMGQAIFGIDGPDEVTAGKLRRS